MQNEKNEDKSLSDTFPQESGLKKEEVTSSLTSSAGDSLKRRVISPKLLYLSLFESAMRYREAYWRDDIEAYEKLFEEDRESKRLAIMEGLKKEGRSFNERAFNRNYDKMKKEAVIKMRYSLEKFNKEAYLEIESVVKKFSETAKTAFDEFSTGFALIGEEFLLAADKHDFLIVCQAYNSGKFQGPLQHLKNKKDEKAKYINVNPVQHNADVNAVQEENHSTSREPAPTFDQSAIVDLGHQQKRELQVNHHIEPDGNDHESDHLP